MQTEKAKSSHFDRTRGLKKQIFPTYMHLFLQMSKLKETTSYFDENVGRVGVKSDTVS